MRPVDRLWFGRKLILVAGDVLVFAFVLAAISYIRDAEWMSPGLVWPFLPLVAFSIVAAYAAGLYELRVIRDFVALNGGLLGSSVACSLFGTTYFYLLLPSLRFSPKIALLLVVVGSHVGMLLWRRAVLATTGFNLVDLTILILGDRRYVTALPRELKLVQRFGPDVHLVVVDRAWASAHPHDTRQTLASAIAHLVPVVDIDEFHESLFGKVSPEHAQDLAWALDHVLPRSGSPYFKAKRAFDVLAATAMLVAAAPLFIVVAALIAMIDGVTPLYTQERVGYLGRTFLLLKFRTMRLRSEEGGPFTAYPANHDPRVTRVGRVLRRLHIDELPQLWNVMKGDMSLVGPRPEWAKEVEILEKAIPTYTLRYLVPPGLTGWAQVYFRATNSPDEAIEKHNYDLYYLKHFSLALDFSILLKTVKRIFVADPLPPMTPALRPINVTLQPEGRVDIASIVGRS